MLENKPINELLSLSTDTATTINLPLTILHANLYDITGFDFGNFLSYERYDNKKSQLFYDIVDNIDDILEMLYKLDRNYFLFYKRDRINLVDSLIEIYKDKPYWKLYEPDLIKFYSALCGFFLVDYYGNIYYPFNLIFEAIFKTKTITSLDQIAFYCKYTYGDTDSMSKGFYYAMSLLYTNDRGILEAIYKDHKDVKDIAKFFGVTEDYVNSDIKAKTFPMLYNHRNWILNGYKKANMDRILADEEYYEYLLEQEDEDLKMRDHMFLDIYDTNLSRECIDAFGEDGCDMYYLYTTRKEEILKDNPKLDEKLYDELYTYCRRYLEFLIPETEEEEKQNKEAFKYLEQRLGNLVCYNLKVSLNRKRKERGES